MSYAATVAGLTKVQQLKIKSRFFFGRGRRLKEKIECWEVWYHWGKEKYIDSNQFRFFWKRVKG